MSDAHCPCAMAGDKAKPRATSGRRVESGRLMAAFGHRHAIIAPTSCPSPEG